MIEAPSLEALLMLAAAPGSPEEQALHERVKSALEAALVDTPPVLVGHEAMAQGLALLTGHSLEQCRGFIFGVVKDLSARGALVSASGKKAPWPTRTDPASGRKSKLGAR
jgi:hypothetical protein